MMKLYGVLVLFVTFSVASGLRCYICVTSDPNGCTNDLTCPDGFDRCASAESEGLIQKSCWQNASCIPPIQCCDKDLCNGAVLTGNGPVPTGPGVILLLLSSALMMLFI
ncbi:PREDICTED: lymphocyte antigen 6G-like isoform X2 [Poecilia mexicana]|uniref:lymphocyte antigen 6G-like isoform X2 n=1 Tax=Poecilia mexicana TaxID=48701 RepID=UPI00072E13BA|nr:PREDICTED: lymphocyte antigen 6G-like isoform X2 [Poecilia mexicana]